MSPIHLLLNDQTTSIFTRVCLVCLSFCLLACNAQPNNVPSDAANSSNASPSNTLPQAVTQLIERAETCQHFAGELNGDQSARDKEVNAQMASLGCDTLATDIADAQREYADTPAIVKALNAHTEY